MLDCPMSFSTVEIGEIVSNELTRYPKAALVDIYKLLNQAHYGPTHIIPDASLIKKNILKELNAIIPRQVESLQDIGLKRGYYRVNLMTAFADFLNDIIADNRITDSPNTYQANLLDDFIQSILDSRVAFRADNPTWVSIWNSCREQVYDLVIPMDSEIVEVNNILVNDALPSHSHAFKRCYGPHYRVVHIDCILTNPQLKNLIQDR